MKDETGGDPIHGIKWTRKSTRKVSRELKRRGHRLGPRTVARLLKEQGYSLRANVKRLSGKRHPDREMQFRQIGRKVQVFRGQGLPVLSLDAKKKEIVTNFYNGGRIWRQEEIAVADHDFPSKDLGRAIPYGIYDTVLNRGMVVVGTSHETSTFGVDALAQWYRREGRQQYPEAGEILLLVDNGGCNGSKRRLWKVELQRFADEFGLIVRVAHFPPGASKWNPIEHRMFSFISKNWAGQPLKTYETILNYIKTTTTETGLRIKAVLNSKEYPTGIKVTDEQLQQVNLRKARLLPRWNYAVRPHRN